MSVPIHRPVDGPRQPPSGKSMKWRAPAGETQYERLWSRIHASPADPVNGCWMWQGVPHPKGYARIQADGKVQYVHRYLWEAENGDLPKGAQLKNTCENVACVNPRHWQVRTPVHAS